MGETPKPPPPALSLGVLISGRGSNLGAILDAIARGELDARIQLVVSNKADAPGLEIAAKAGVATRVIPHGAFPDRAAFDAAVAAALTEAGCEIIVLAGFMRVLGASFVDAFPNRIVNIHPSLLPAFPGVDAQAQALAYGACVTGCTVHLVDHGTDTGPVLAQAIVPILASDDRASLAARILPLEHALLVLALRWLAAGDVSVVTQAGARPAVLVRGVERRLITSGS